MSKNKMVKKLVPVTPEVAERLEKIKKRTGNSIISIIRTAIDEYLERNKPMTQTVEQDAIIV